MGDRFFERWYIVRGICILSWVIYGIERWCFERMKGREGMRQFVQLGRSTFNTKACGFSVGEPTLFIMPSIAALRRVNLLERAENSSSLASSSSLCPLPSPSLDSQS